jgi:hypothetical protein
MRTGVPGEGGKLAVRDDLPVRDPPQRFGNRALERGRLVEIDLDVEEVVLLACEEPGKARRERMSLDSRDDPGSRQLVPEEKLPLEHDLAHAPALRCVGQLPRHA